MAYDHEGSSGAEQHGPSAAARGGAPGKRTRSEGLIQRAASSSGAALPAGVQAKFEGSLGADLSGVRVHTGRESAEAATSIGAQAYATGNDIHFAAGKYQPEDPFGMHLLAHEVAHTVQQGQTTVAGPQLRAASGGSYDAAERDADRAADAMVRGEATTVGRAPAGTVQCFFDDLIDAASDAVSGAVDAVESAFSGGSEPASDAASDAAQQMGPQPAPTSKPTPAPAPKPAPKPPAKTPYDQHQDAERGEHQRDRDTPADYHSYDNTQEHEHRRRRRGGDEDNGEDSDKPDVPAEDLQQRRVAYRESLRAGDEADEHYVPATEGELTKLEVFQSLSRVGAGYPRALRAMLTGHSFGEQGGRNVVGYNYSGQEYWRFTRPKSDKRKWTRAFRSDFITRAEYEANPDYFWDWPQSGTTIAKQLAKGSNKIACMYPGPRAVWTSLDDASRAFWHNVVGWRLNACRSSANPEHRALAQGALDGDVDAYISMVELNDSTIKVRPYNGNPQYRGIVKPQIEAALRDPKLHDE